MKILVNCTGFIGDILFASSLAKKFKEKYEGCVVHYQIPLIQPKLLLEQNPYVDKVIGPGDEPAGVLYNLIFSTPTINQAYPATVQIQAAAGIEDQSLEFDVYTVPELDIEAKASLERWREVAILKGKNPDCKLVAFQNNWVEKSFLFTEEEYDRAVDVPHLGYGGKRRDISKICRLLDDDSRNFLIIPIGMQAGVSQRDPQAHDADSYAYAASLIKHCDWFIGGEGGLSNLAAAVGTRCIITTDYIWQLYGPRGVIRRIENPPMGPATYYPDAGHKHLSPFLGDEEVYEAIVDIIFNVPAIDEEWWKLK
jgi:hypothetical protein